MPKMINTLFISVDIESSEKINNILNMIYKEKCKSYTIWQEVYVNYDFQPSQVTNTITFQIK